MLAVLATAACAPSYSVPASYWNSNHYYEVEKDIARKQVALDADLTDLYGQAAVLECHARMSQASPQFFPCLENEAYKQYGKIFKPRH